MEAFFKEKAVKYVEAVVPDMAGIARGKLLPVREFLSATAMRMPLAALAQTITGQTPYSGRISHADPDIQCVPDPDTLRILPWAVRPTAQVIHDCTTLDGDPVDISPRQVLRNIVKLFDAKGWKAVVAPEIEFYLLAEAGPAEQALTPYHAEPGRRMLSVESAAHFESFFADLAHGSQLQGWDIGATTHECGSSQLEINFLHGDPLALADRVFLFKRTVRELATQHGMCATFMAKPMDDEAGSAMHLHQSLVDMASGKNLFANADGSPHPLLYSFIAGLQKYTPALMAIFAPYGNSYRRLCPHKFAPTNLQWGIDNRSTGFRIPDDARARRVENRLPGMDCNPYLAIAASLAAGYLGIQEGLTPTAQLHGNAYDLPHDLPLGLASSLVLLNRCDPLIGLLGESFVNTYTALKEMELAAECQGVSAWDRRFLLHI